MMVFYREGLLKSEMMETMMMGISRRLFVKLSPLDQGEEGQLEEALLVEEEVIQN